MKEQKNESEMLDSRQEDLTIYDEDDDATIWDLDSKHADDRSPLERIPIRPARKYFQERRRRLQSMTFEEKIKEHQKQVAIRTSTLVLIIAIAVVGFVLIKENMAYTKYKVVETEQREAGTAVEYVEVYDKILRYSKDGASYYEKQGKNIWNETYEIQTPLLDVCEKYMLIAEQNGMKAYVFNLEGLVRTVDTTSAIVDAQVSEKGTVVFLLKDTEVDGHWIQYQDVEGNVIAEGRLPFKTQGYPLDMSLSKDGEKLMVSYLKTEAERMRTQIVFYNFTNAGAAQTDNIVAEETLDNTIVPVVHCAGNSKMIAMGEEGAYLYKGSQTPKLQTTITYPDKAKSVFCDEEYFGYIYESPTEGVSYRMEIYDYDAKKVGSCEFDFAYDNVKIKDGQVILYNDSQWTIYKVNGNVRLKPCNFSGMMQEVVPLSKDRFLLVSARKTEVVKLK